MDKLYFLHHAIVVLSARVMAPPKDLFIDDVDDSDLYVRANTYMIFKFMHARSYFALFGARRLDHDFNGPLQWAMSLEVDLARKFFSRTWRSSTGSHDTHGGLCSSF
jgi:hypothetical protein